MYSGICVRDEHIINLRENIMSSCGQIQFSSTALQHYIVAAAGWIGHFSNILLRSFGSGKSLSTE